MRNEGSCDKEDVLISSLTEGLKSLFCILNINYNLFKEIEVTFMDSSENRIHF